MEIVGIRPTVERSIRAPLLKNGRASGYGEYHDSRPTARLEFSGIQRNARSIFQRPFDRSAFLAISKQFYPLRIRNV